MKISQNSINLLKHCASLNPGIIVDAGNQIFSTHQSRAVRVQAVIPEEFPVRFAISELNQFLNTVSLFDDPDFEFSEKCVHITAADGHQKMNYYYSDPNLIHGQENKPLREKLDYNIVLDISKDDLNKINKAAAVIGVDDICIFNKGKDVYIAALDKQKGDVNAFELFLTSDEKFENVQFKIFFRRCNLKLTNNDFQVSIYKKNKSGLSTWVATDSPFDELIYYITIELDSEYNVL